VFEGKRHDVYPQIGILGFLCIFHKDSAMATLGLKEMGKFLWKGREKGLPCNKSYVSFVNVSKSHMCKLSMYQKSMYTLSKNE
jgi:hypothetical protein